MYAIVESGGKQHKAVPGGLIEVELLAAEVGQPVMLDRVLLVADGDAISVGQPTVAGAAVKATVVRHALRRKVTFFHYVPKKRQRKKVGHRQPFTVLRIEAIEA